MGRGSRLIQLVLLHFAWAFWVTLVLKYLLRDFQMFLTIFLSFSYQGMEHVLGVSPSNIVSCVSCILEWVLELL